MRLRWAIPVQVLLAVLVIAACQGRQGLAPTEPPGSSTNAPTTIAPATPVAPSVSAPPRNSNHPLSAEELLSAITAARESAEPWRDVVFAGSLDPTRKPIPIERECAELTPCTVIGTLEGLDEDVGIVAMGHRDPLANLPPPTAPDDLRGPIALQIPRTGPILYLGHVQPGANALPWTVAEAAKAIPSITNGRVLAVDGWLTSVATSCGPAPMPFDPPLPNPFNCQPPGWIGSDDSGGPPKVDVQTFAYLEFASDPQQSGSGSPYAGRRGIYLLRWVEYEAANCHDCRRFLVVGRLDATPPSPNDVAGMPVVRSADELAWALAHGPNLTGQVVFVDGQIVPGRPQRACSGADACPIGTLAGRPVVATPYTISLLLPDTDFPTHGLVALRVQADSLEYLGYFGVIDDPHHSATATFPILRDTSQLPGGPALAIGRGWLVGVSDPCPMPANPPEPDTPFGPCELGWLTPVAEQPVRRTPSGYEISTPTDGIVVQPTAYWNFAPDPQAAEGIGSEPRLGTYLLREVQDKPNEPDAKRGWQVVARLDP